LYLCEILAQAQSPSLHRNRGC